jgi:hypothetical protein
MHMDMLLPIGSRVKETDAVSTTFCCQFDLLRSHHRMPVAKAQFVNADMIDRSARTNRDFASSGDKSKGICMSITARGNEVGVDYDLQPVALFLPPSRAWSGASGMASVCGLPSTGA